MRSLRIVFLIIVAFGLLTLTHGMEMAASSSGLTNTDEVSPMVAGEVSDIALFEDSPVASPAGGGKVLVIPTAKAGEAATMGLFNAATQDLTIMGRVFDKELGLGADGLTLERYLGTGYRRNLMYDLALGPRARNTSCMYLQGHAAVFLMNVDFPLAPGPEEPNVKPKTNDDPTDMIWHRTKQELYGARSTPKKKDSPEKYDPKRVEHFETNLLKTLKHATNIECVGPDEWIIAVVWGPGSGSGQPKSLVVRAKKSDVTTFATGTSTLEEFRDQILVLTVPGGPRPWSP